MNREQKIELGGAIISSKQMMKVRHPDNSCIFIANIALNKIEDIRVKADPGGIKKGIDPSVVSEEEKHFKAMGEATRQWVEEGNKLARARKSAETVKLNLPPRPPPNCSICQWRELEPQLKVLIGPPHIPKNKCTAQGDRYIKNVYGNKICKRLFQESEPVTCEEK